MSDTETTVDEQPTAGPQPQQQAPMAQSTASSDSRRKSPFLACVLSAMPGLGQVYVGYYQRGFINMAVAALTIAMLSTQNDFSAIIPMGGIFLAFFWLYNIVDAGRRAALYNEMLDGRTDIELPQDFEMPGLQGSIVGGATLAVVGFLLLMHTRFDFSLDWLEEWWPAALILFGAYLIYKARKGEEERKARRTYDDE